MSYVRMSDLAELSDQCDDLALQESKFYVVLRAQQTALRNATDGNAPAAVIASYQTLVANAQRDVDRATAARVSCDRGLRSPAQIQEDADKAARAQQAATAQSNAVTPTASAPYVPPVYTSYKPATPAAPPPVASAPAFSFSLPTIDFSALMARPETSAAAQPAAPQIVTVAPTKRSGIDTKTAVILAGAGGLALLAVALIATRD